jgi:uncharacterized RDD family membrane protein YckC
MNRQPNRSVRIRLTVEALESRELPSVNLAALRPMLAPAAMAQVRFQLTPPWRPGSTLPGPPIVRIIGILIALYGGGS